jgi:hypothetical protein
VELPPAQPHSRVLIQEYHATTYSHSPNGDLDGAVRAGSEIRMLSLKAWLRRLFTETDSRKNRYRRF